MCWIKNNSFIFRTTAGDQKNKAVSSYLWQYWPNRYNSSVSHGSARPWDVSNTPVLCSTLTTSYVLSYLLPNCNWHSSVSTVSELTDGRPRV